MKNNKGNQEDQMKSKTSSTFSSIESTIRNKSESVKSITTNVWGDIGSFVGNILSDLGLGPNSRHDKQSSGGGPTTTGSPVIPVGKAEGGVVKGPAASFAKGGGLRKARQSQLIEWGEGPSEEAAIFVTKDRRHRRDNEKYAGVAAGLLGGTFIPERDRKKMGFKSGVGEGLGATHYNVDADIRKIADNIANATGTKWNTYAGHGLPGGSTEDRTVDFWGAGGRGSPVSSSQGYKTAEMALKTNPLYVIRQGEYWRGGNWQPWPSDPHYDHTHVSWHSGNSSGMFTTMPNPDQLEFERRWKELEGRVKSGMAPLNGDPYWMARASVGLTNKQMEAMRSKIDGMIPDTISGPSGTGPETGSSPSGLTAGETAKQGGWGSLAGTAVGIMGAESSFNARAQNPSGARGLFQIMPGTASAVGANYDQLYDPLYNSSTGKLVEQAQGLSAWVAYTSGAYRNFMGQENAPITGYAKGGVLPKYHDGGMVRGRPGSEVHATLEAGEVVIPRDAVRSFAAGGGLGWNLVGGDGYLGIGGSAAGDAIAGIKNIWGSAASVGPGSDVNAYYAHGRAAATTGSAGNMRVDPWVRGSAIQDEIWGHEGGHAYGLAHGVGIMQAAVRDGLRPTPEQLATVAKISGKQPGQEGQDFSGGGHSNYGNGSSITVTQTQVGGSSSGGYSHIFGGPSATGGRGGGFASIPGGPSARGGGAGNLPADLKRAANAGEGTLREMQKMVKQLERLPHDIREGMGHNLQFGRNTGKRMMKGLDRGMFRRELGGPALSRAR